MEEMTLDYNATMNSIALWGSDPAKFSANFYMLDQTKLETIRTKMFEVAGLLWMEFKNRNMFDVFNVGDLSFPFVLQAIVGTNLMFIKDNVISSNEVNLYGNRN